MSDEFPAETVESVARIFAKWINYSWEGLSDRDISDRFPDWAYNGIGDLGYQGGKPGLRKLALAVLRASGHAELVAALELARPYVRLETQNIKLREMILAKIDSALAAAGEKI